VSKETYYSVKRDLLQCQKRPTTVSKETYYSVKRDLLQCQKRPSMLHRGWLFPHPPLYLGGGGVEKDRDSRRLEASGFLCECETPSLLSCEKASFRTSPPATPPSPFSSTCTCAPQTVMDKHVSLLLHCLRSSKYMFKDNAINISLLLSSHTEQADKDRERETE